jgi:hypothetical protein
MPSLLFKSSHFPHEDIKPENLISPTSLPRELFQFPPMNGQMQIGMLKRMKTHHSSMATLIIIWKSSVFRYCDLSAFWG